MRVAAFVADHSGCGTYRIKLPAAAVAAHGVETTVAQWLPVGWCGSPTRPLATHIQGLDDIDVVVIQRPMDELVADAIPLLQAKGIAVVVDLDDDLDHIHPRSSAWGAYRDHDRISLRHLHRACGQADLVTVSTDALRRYAPDRSVVVRNAVPTSWLAIRPSHEGMVVGWSGALATHPTDLRQAAGVGAAVGDRRFRVVGLGDGVRQELGLRSEPEETGWLAYEDYPWALAALDVGIVPLAPGPFNDAKSALKGLEMAALGVPFVASPTPEYRKLHKVGVGLLAERGRAWRGSVARLLADQHLREDMSATGVQVVTDHLTVEGNAWRWVEAWEEAQNRRRKAPSQHSTPISAASASAGPVKEPVVATTAPSAL